MSRAGGDIMADEIRIPIDSEYDIVTARHRVKELGSELQFTSGEQTLVATCVSELARNIVEYAGRGEIVVAIVEKSEKRGLAVTAKDNGPGIADVDEAMKDGFSTSKGLGLGLPGCRRIMDEFAVTSKVGEGTVVTARKWKR
jgi:serine/threonine-protein kinase RsbT